MKQRLLATLACLFAAMGSARAESPRVKIVSARVGFPDARNSESPPICKFAAWSPLDLELELLSEVADSAQLVVETPDADGLNTTLATPLDLSKARPGTLVRMQAYVRPAAGSGETTVIVRTANGRALSEPYRIRTLRPRDSLTYVVLGLGSRFPNFDLPRQTTPGAVEAETATGPLRGGRVELAAITEVSQLPDRWFGYEAADLVVLSTSSADFVKQLGANEKKLAALREWVNRGGRLVISVGSNAAALASFPAILELAPAALNPAAPTRLVKAEPKIGQAKPDHAASLPLYWTARETSQSTILSGNLVSKAGPFPVANFLAKPGARVVIPPPSRGADAKDAVAVQAAFGLGRITAIGFDLDRSPFTEFARQAEFWDWVLREGGANRTSVGSEGKARPLNAAPTDDEDEVAVALRTHVDTFDGIPVVSFGSVALLIVLYILLIAPVEYYFLKRVFGRLELTWITFPIIVLTVCIAAAVSASAMKGNELRVNKVDVIDVVAEGRGGRVYGTTMFTIFSPKIDTFTLRVSPAAGWTVDPTSEASLVGWVGGPRAGRASLLRRNYGYHSDANGAIADGLDNVPVQVWSTKSFSANWAGTLNPRSPVVESKLVHPPGDSSKAIGTFVNRMPFEAVTDCMAFYAGQAYPIGTILKGQEVRLVLERGQLGSQWLQDRGQLADLLSRGQAFGGAASASNKPGTATPAPVPTSSTLPLWGLLFHEASLKNDEGVVPRNASLRRLDQSWRLSSDNRSEVIVVGRVLPPSGTIDAIFGGHESPSRLQLKEGQTLVPGFARQETYVRLYLPVRSH